jgi:tripartite-type tricarboxylate transporter receptor subunit TctC
MPSSPISLVRPSRRQVLTAAAGSVASLAAPAWAQNAGGWPSKPIRLIVPYTPGGFTDQMARLIQNGLQTRLGQTVMIDNKPGAGSVIGVDAVAKSAPDGSTFGVVIAAYAANNTLYPSCPMTLARTSPAWR